MAKSDIQEAAEWFGNVCKAAEKYRENLVKDLKSSDLTREELIELAADAEVRSAVTTKVMTKVSDALTQTSAGDHLPKDFGGSLLMMAVTAGMETQKKTHAKHGALTRLSKDPKQKEKGFVYECWQLWQQQPSDYKGKAAFARDMLDKCEYLTSQKIIEDWCREWETITQQDE